MNIKSIAGFSLESSSSNRYILYVSSFCMCFLLSQQKLKRQLCRRTFMSLIKRLLPDSSSSLKRVWPRQLATAQHYYTDRWNKNTQDQWEDYKCAPRGSFSFFIWCLSLMLSSEVKPSQRFTIKNRLRYIDMHWYRLCKLHWECPDYPSCLKDRKKW